MIVQLHRNAVIAVMATLFVVLVLGVLSVPARATGAGAGWELTGRTYPTNLAPGGQGAIVLDVLNVGAAGSTGTVTVTDRLPEGVTATKAGERLHLKAGKEPETGSELWVCTGNGPGSAPRVLDATVVTCKSNVEKLPSIAGGGGYPGFPTHNPEPEVMIGVSVAQGASEGSVVNHATVAGGGAQTPASTEDQVAISSNPAGFGIAGWDAWFSNADGTLDTQAGSHPYAATFTIDLNSVVNAHGSLHPAGGEFRHVDVNLPPGLIGDPHAVPQCARQAFLAGVCPAASMVGIITVAISLGQGNTLTFQVFNMVPPSGMPAELAFNFGGIKTFIDVGVRTGGDYGIATHVNNIPQQSVFGNVLTVWGVPSDKSHDIWRLPNQTGCTEEEVSRSENGCISSGRLPDLRPFLTLPTSCAGPQVFSIRTSTWQEPIAEAEASMVSHDSQGNPAGFTGCEHLEFGPTITGSPDTGRADTPAGMTFDVKPPVGGLTDPEGLGTSDIEGTTVTLPGGMVINPGQAAGLQACQSWQDGLTTEAERMEGRENDGPPSCPSASKVGTAEAETPLLKNKLVGNVYLLQANPPNLQLLVSISGEGVNVKLVGNVHLDEATGQILTTFKGIPEVPVSDFKLSFSGGGQAALATPTRCGTYTANTDFAPWGSPFLADFQTTSSFAIEEGPGGTGCPSGPLPFSPSLIAGSTTDQAGGFTNFSLLLKQADGQQRIEKLQFKIPQGLLGMISRVPLCPEPQASAGTCSSASQIGHTVVASGPGPYPLVVPQPGQPPAAIYLTGPYKGAPYGLSIVVPVVVGPFVLQTQIVRAQIAVDPLTAQITVTTDRFPQIIDGIPTDLRTINAVIDKPGFMFNPTNCAPMSFSGTAWGTPPPDTTGPGTTAPISSHFQMGSCQALKFKPDFKVSTAGKTSRKNGASLDVKVLYPTGPLGSNQASSQSNIAQVKVDLPKQLPSRLTTLQKACTAATFEANPAACPSASRVGQVTAVTPVLPVPLTGPAIFVSYGGAKFPELVFVLQGYGVTVYVHAETFISKAGITSSTLRHVPDVPITSFELKLPQGPFSALAANGNLCTSKLKMPTAFTAQNGAVIHQNTLISVTGCPKAKKSKGKKADAHFKNSKHKKR
jgi:hypothetical protein